MFSLCVVCFWVHITTSTQSAVQPVTKFYLTTMTYNSAVLIESGDLFNVTEGYIVTTEASRSVPYQMKLIKNILYTQDMCC